MPRRLLQGVVLSTKMKKTIVVVVERRFSHPVMRKVVRRTKHYMAHDEREIAKVGQLVWIRECRPISKNKTWEMFNEAMGDNAKASDDKKTTKKTAGGKK